MIAGVAPNVGLLREAARRTCTCLRCRSVLSRCSTLHRLCLSPRVGVAARIRSVMALDCRHGRSHRRSAGFASRCTTSAPAKWPHCGKVLAAVREVAEFGDAAGGACISRYVLGSAEFEGRCARSWRPKRAGAARFISCRQGVRAHCPDGFGSVYTAGEVSSALCSKPRQPSA